MTTEHKNIHEAIWWMCGQIGYVQKTGKNTNQNYTFASEVDFIKAVRPIMHEAKVYSCCTGVNDLNVDVIRKTKKDIESVSIRTVAVLEYTLHHWPSGTEVKVCALAEGSDTLDKASYKAMTGGQKYSIRQTLLIETGNDPDENQEIEDKRKVEHKNYSAWADNVIDRMNKSTDPMAFESGLTFDKFVNNKNIIDDMYPDIAERLAKAIKYNRDRFDVQAEATERSKPAATNDNQGFTVEDVMEASNG